MSKKKLEIFSVFFSTKYGIECKKIRANNFFEAYKKTGKKTKMKTGWIENDNNESMTFNQILRTEETI